MTLSLYVLQHFLSVDHEQQTSACLVADPGVRNDVPWKVPVVGSDATATFCLLQLSCRATWLPCCSVSSSLSSVHFLGSACEDFLLPRAPNLLSLVLVALGVCPSPPFSCSQTAGPEKAAVGWGRSSHSCAVFTTFPRFSRSKARFF